MPNGGSARPVRECLDGMLIFSERQLWRVTAEYEKHYNTPPAPLVEAATTHR